ncbi:MAG: ATP-binding protein [Gemmataceae bacterium]
MAISVVEILARLNRTLASMDAVRQGDAPARAALLARLGAGLDETSVAGLCRLQQGENAALTVCDPAGAPRADWQAILEDELNWASLPEWQAGQAPAGLQLPGHVLALKSEPEASLALGLVLPKPRGRQALSLLRELLSAVIAHAKLAANAGPASAALLCEERNKGDVAECASVFHHELGNTLNNLMLDAAALERELDGNGSPRIKEIKQTVACFAEQMKLFLQYRHARRTAAYPVDLHEILRGAVRDLGGPIQLDLADDVPHIPGTASDLTRLVRLLLSNARACGNGQPGHIVVHTERQGQNVLLTVTAPGPQLSVEEWRRVFEPFEDVAEGINGLELAVCRSLARRFQGKLSGQSNAPGHTVFTCEFATEMG